VATYRKYICPARKQKTGVEILYGMPSYELAELESWGLLPWVDVVSTSTIPSENA